MGERDGVGEGPRVTVGFGDPDGVAEGPSVGVGVRLGRGVWGSIGVAVRDGGVGKSVTTETAVVCAEGVVVCGEQATSNMMKPIYTDQRTIFWFSFFREIGVVLIRPSACTLRQPPIPLDSPMTQILQYSS